MPGTKRLRPHAFARLAIAIVAALPTGCASLQSSGGSSSTDTTSASTERGSAATGGGVDTRADYGNIPRSAERVTSGNGRLTYVVPHEGVVWVGNETRRYEVVKHNVRRGDRVDVEPARDVVRLNDEPIFEHNMERNDRHAVYYREAGSTSTGPAAYADIPGDADDVATGSGTVTWRAERAGHIWVGDNKLRRLVVTHRVHAGELVEVNPGHDEVKVNGQVIYNQNLESRHQHSIFFR